MSVATAPHTNGFLSWLAQRWLGVVITLLFTVILIQNIAVVTSVNVTLLWATMSMPMWVLLLVIFLIGTAVGMVFSRNRARKHGK